MWKRFSSASAYVHYPHEPHILAITWPSLLLNIARIANVHGIYLVGAHSTIRISVISPCIPILFHGNIEHPYSHTDSLVASFSLGTLRLL